MDMVAGNEEEPTHDAGGPLVDEDPVAGDDEGIPPAAGGDPMPVDDHHRHLRHLARRLARQQPAWPWAMGFPTSYWASECRGSWAVQVGAIITMHA